MKMNATEIAARREQIKTTRANIKTVVDVYRETIEQTPAETVAAIVERLGYDTAREAIAEIVNTVGEWDGRISLRVRMWALDVDSAATANELEAARIYQPSEIHPVHLNQIADAMSKYTPPTPPESEQEAQEAQDTAEIMKQAGALELTHRVALYIPGTTDTDKPADNAAQVKRVASRFCEMFGGATAQQSAGYWMSERAGLVAESVTIVYAACTKAQHDAHLTQVLELAQDIKREMAQEAVSVELDGTLYII